MTDGKTLQNNDDGDCLSDAAATEAPTAATAGASVAAFSVWSRIEKSG
jgi:hypothetical protein